MCLFASYPESGISLLGNGQFQAARLGETDPRLVPLTNDEDVSKPGGKCMIPCILQVHNVESSRMFFVVSDDTDASHVMSPRDDGNVPNTKLYKGIDFPRGKIKVDGVIGPDE